MSKNWGIHAFMQVYRDAAIDLAPLQNKTVAMLGYGNQGRPQALNLRDSGINVVVGLRENSAKWDIVRSDRLTPLCIADAIKQSDVLMLQFPDELMHTIFKTSIAPYLRSGQYLGFSHGMAITAGWIIPPTNINVFLLAPKAQGRGVRNQYVAGSGVPALVDVHQDPSDDSLEIALAYGKAIGCGKAGIIKTTFAQETQCDLFSEQAVLCGGLTQLIKTAFEVLVEAGYSPEVAYFECLYEVKLIADLLQEGGITFMRDKISSTALFGDLSQGQHVIDGHVKDNMQRVLAKIQSGQFAQDFLQDVSDGKPLIQARQAADYHHAIEETGRRLREAGVL